MLKLMGFGRIQKSRNLLADRRRKKKEGGPVWCRLQNQGSVERKDEGSTGSDENKKEKNAVGGGIRMGLTSVTKRNRKGSLLLDRKRQEARA